MTKQKTIVVIDTHIFAHTIDHTLQSHNWSHEYIDYFARAYLEFLARGLWLPDNYDKSNHWVVMVGDEKPYWRNKCFEDIGVSYKGNRRWTVRPNAEQIFDIIDAFNRAVKDCQGKVLRHFDTQRNFGFEADDWASAICRLKQPETRVLLLTTDIDWLGLTQIDNVHWINAMQNIKPHGRVRNRTNFCEWFNTWHESKTAVKRGFCAKEPADIYHFKCRYGDRSDTIPPFEIVDEVIDLVSLLEPRVKLENYVNVLERVRSAWLPMQSRLTFDEWFVKAKVHQLFPRIPLDSLSVVY